jgi:hypothetical protein
MMAHRLHTAGLDIAPVVGAGAAQEFAAYLRLYKRLPDIEQILAGKGDKVQFPTEPSVRYAVVIGLALRAADAEQAYNGFRWLLDKASTEWIHLYGIDVMQAIRGKSKEQQRRLLTKTRDDPKLKRFIDAYAKTFPNIQAPT